MFDVVTAGTSWHWVDPLAGAAKAAAVLRPGGLLAVFGHAFQLPADFSAVFATVYRDVAPDSPISVQSTPGNALEQYRALYAKAADGVRQADGFAEPEEWRFDWERSYTRDEWLDQLPTLGALSHLTEDQRARVVEGVSATIGAAFTMPYTTIAVAARRLGAG
jgi:hypothetical protein